MTNNLRSSLREKFGGDHMGKQSPDSTRMVTTFILNNKFYNSFSHESDLRLAVGKNQKNQNALSTALLRNSPANKNAQFCNARVSHVRATPPSKHAFSMRDDNFRRRMRPRERRARSNRRVRADPRLTSGGDGDRFRLFLTETA